MKRLAALLLLAAPLLAYAGEFVTVAATIRNTGAGWYVIKDADHEPIGVASVSNDSEVIRVKLNFKAKKIHTVVVGADDAYATELNLVCGASVAFEYIDIKCGHKGVTGLVNPNTLTLPSGNLWIHGVFTK